MAMTPEEKAERARQRLLDKASEYRPITYRDRFVAPIFQRMIRAEAAAHRPDYHHAIIDGEFSSAFRRVGECVCVTCGQVMPWNAKWMNAGHFLAGRYNSILFEETNVHPQCVSCNMHEHGAQDRYTPWMIEIYGQEEVDRLRRRKNESVSFSKEELVDMRIGYAARLKAAELEMKGGM